MADEVKPTGSSQDDTLLALLATIPILGVIMYFGMNDLSDFAKHYAKQGTALSLIAVASFAIGLIPLIGWLVSCILAIILFVGWVMLVINVFQGKKYELPVVTDLVNQLLNKQK